MTVLNETNPDKPAALPVRIYTPESALRDPQQLVREMGRDLWASRELAWRLVVRDISARYRQSVLGYVWAFLPPLLTSFTFVLLNRSGILASGDTAIPYPAFVLIGTLLWQSFADAVNSPMKSVSGARAMLSKINFPREAILLSGLLEVSFNFLIRMTLLVPVFWYYHLVPPATVPLAIAGVIALICLGFMIGILLTPVGLLYSDVGQSLGLALSFWMLVTPVVYTIPSTGPLAVLAKINPVSPLIVTTREWLTTGVATQLTGAVWIFLASLVLLFCGWMLFRLAIPILVERMGN